VYVQGNTNLVVHHCSYAGPVSVLVSDPWLNTMAQDGSGDNCTIGQVQGFGAGVTPVVVIPLNGFSGILYTYPDTNNLSFVVQDATCGIGADAGIVYPVGFDAAFSCNLTSTPLSGDVLAFPVTDISGQVVDP
jgi:hypothetical protein